MLIDRNLANSRSNDFFSHPLEAMADDLFRVFKSVRKLVREKTEDLFGNVTPLERTMREVLDEETCAVSNSLLRHIAVTTHDAYAYSTVAHAVWTGISSEFWQRIYKCLCLLEFMILLGPERCRQDCAMAQMTIRGLTQYRFHDGRREQGGGVRQRAENILRLINDEAYWQETKEQAIKDSEMYAGGIENQPYISPMSHMNLHSRASNPFFTGPEALPPFAMNPKAGSPSHNPFQQQFRDNMASPFQSPTVYPWGPAAHRTHRTPTGGLYDPGDDFNTTDPFSGRDDLAGSDPVVTGSTGDVSGSSRNAAAGPVGSSSVVGSAATRDPGLATTGQHIHDSNESNKVPSASLLDDVDEFCVAPPANATSKSEAPGAAPSLLNDLLD